jgi:methylenetetrahydrofolate dehydrogenase (NADP+)/methenyltetrahydrofolate cyclohydrolase
MSCQIIDGVAIAAEIKREIKLGVRELKEKTGITPTLVAIISGEDLASQIYVNKKMKTCEEVGIISHKISISSEFEDIRDTICRLNTDDNVHGYILQLPLSNGLDPRRFFCMFDPIKDVDVFHPENVGMLVQGNPRFKPCTPHGIQQLLRRSGIQVSGKKVCIINRSNVVGKPLSSMLIQECDDYANATVTVCHDRTPPDLLKSVARTADIVVVAVGKPNFLTVDMVKEGVGVVDVGITRIGNKIVGDVHPDVYEIASWATPVPGGVGPLTICMLLENTLIAAKLSLGLL